MEHSINNVGWAVGVYCNAKCSQCYSREIREEEDFLTPEDVTAVLDKLKKNNIKTINLGGNEPIFTHSLSIKDSLLPYIIREIKRRGFILGITTNGTTMLSLYKNYYEEFIMVDDWDISLDSPFREEHDKNRGVGFFDIAIDALQLTERKKIKCSIIYCLMNWNCTVNHAKSLSDLTNKYKVDLRINTLKPVRKELFDLEATTEQIHSFFHTLHKYYNVIHNSDIATLVLNDETVSTCACGKSSFEISPKKNGKIKIAPCVYLQKFAVGNLLKMEIEEIYKEEIFNLFTNDSHTFCDKCTYRNMCKGGCYAYSILTSDFTKCDTRCPILDKTLTSIKVQPNSEIMKKHVHENYLCTWIGGNK